MSTRAYTQDQLVEQPAIDELAHDRSAKLPEPGNREVYLLLKEGVNVSVPDKEHGGQKAQRVKVIKCIASMLAARNPAIRPR